MPTKWTVHNRTFWALHEERHLTFGRIKASAVWWAPTGWYVSKWFPFLYRCIYVEIRRPDCVRREHHWFWSKRKAMNFAEVMWKMSGHGNELE